MNVTEYHELTVLLQSTPTSLMLNFYGKEELFIYHFFIPEMSNLNLTGLEHSNEQVEVTSVIQ